MFTNSFPDQLDDLLFRICEKLQISKTQSDKAEGSYDAISKWLSEGKMFSDSNLQIYPQGSFKIGTTVKPLKSQEYDIDLVCEIDQSWHGKDPVQVLNIIEKRMRNNQLYSQMTERKNRCIRLNYANEFHMDILPAFPISTQHSNGFLKVPDREAHDWKDSNPKGYASWFQNRSDIKRFVLEKRAKVEPLPARETTIEKPPLKLAVQLMKRHRDILFKDNPDAAPVSIVLTTLAGEYYGQELYISESIANILARISINLPPGRRLKVNNPSHPGEDLSERWNDSPELYQYFVKFIKDFQRSWRNVTETRGIPEISKILEDMFGEEVVVNVLKEQTEYLEKARREGRLSITNTTGILTTSSMPGTTLIKRNTFYGNE